jgi:hypothetical protein
MIVGNRRYFGKGAREEAAKALTHAVMSWRDDRSLAPRAQYRGFEILSRGNGTKRFDGEAELPELFVRGKETYRANLNAENPIGTIQSIEHALRALDRLVEEEQALTGRQEKALADYKVALDHPFEHEQRLRDLLVKQAELNAALDLDKNEHQVAPDSTETEVHESPPSERSTFVSRLQAADNRVAAMAP